MKIVIFKCDICGVESQPYFDDPPERWGNIYIGREKYSNVCENCFNKIYAFIDELKAESIDAKNTEDVQEGQV